MAWTDVFQGLLMFIGFLLLFFINQQEFGGLHSAVNEIREIAPEKTAVPGMITQISWISYVCMFFAAPFYPHCIQRIFAAKSENTLRKGFATVVFAPYIATLSPMMIGLLAITRYSLPANQTDQVFSLVMRDLMLSSYFGYIVVSILMVRNLLQVLLKKSFTRQPLLRQL